MAKKNFTDNLLGSNRAKKLDMLVSGTTAEANAPAEAEAQVVERKTQTAKIKAMEPEVVETAAKVEKTAPKKRGRKKKDGEKDSFFYTVDKEFLFEVKAAAFWDRRDISEFITLALKHYMYEEMGESDIRRAAREYRKRQEEASK